MTLVLFVILGLVVGSFIGAYTFRYPRGVSIARGRSFCPKCKKTIAWFDNLPVVSYLILGGRCRSCRKKISLRYPLIELISAIGFVFLAPNLFWIFIFSLLLAIFVIDLETQIIPDELVFWGFIIALLVFALDEVASFALDEVASFALDEVASFAYQDFNFYANLLAGLGAAVFLLLVHLVTRGRGMGLGDVKLALLLGFLLGPISTFSWLIGAFWLGGGVGLGLLLLGKTTLKKKIAFGPFLIASFFVILKWGWLINAVLLW